MDTDREKMMCRYRGRLPPVSPRESLPNKPALLTLWFWTSSLWNVHAKLLQLFPTLCNPMDRSPPGSSVHGFSRQEYWSRLSCPPPRDLPNSGIESMSFKSPALARRLFITSATWEATQTVVLFHGFNRKPIQLIMPVLWMKLIDTEQVIWASCPNT